MSLISSYQDAFFRDLSMLGGSLFYTLLLLATVFFQQFGLLRNLVIGFLISLLAIILIRACYFKPRPEKKNYHNFIEKIDASAFPSWHAARAVFLAVTLGKFSGNTTILVLLASLALLVSYSRIYLQRHDWIDVLGGIALGIGTYWIMTLF